MPITHHDCREAIAARDVAGNTTAATHLETCPTCQRFAARVADLDRRAASAAPGPAPAGLADRVLAALPSDGARGDGRARWPRRWQLVAAVAAAVLLVAGVASSRLLAGTTARTGDQTEPLLAAATHFEEDGASQVMVEVSTDIHVEANGREADFSQAPPEVRGFMEQQWQRMMAEIDRQLAELDQRINEMLSQFDRTLDDAFGGQGGTRPRPPEPRDERAGEPAPAPPDGASLSFRVRASGVVDPTGGVQLQGEVAAVSGTIATPSTEVSFAVDASAGTRAVRTPDGEWAVAEPGSGPLGVVLLDPRAIPTILRAAEGDITSRTSSAGTEYDFRLDGAVLRSRTPRWEASALIDGDGRVRRLTLSPVPGSSSPVETEVRLDVTGRGALDTGRRPTPMEGRVAADAGSPLAPVAPAVRAILAGETR